MPFKSFNGIEMHYVHHLKSPTSCETPPVLLLSGMASDSASWQPIVAQLRQQYELILPDNRCSGRTQPMPVACSREQMVSDLIALLDALNIERVAAVGHSMGGMLGWALAAQAPERIACLISVSALPTALPSRVALFRTLAGLRTEYNEQLWFEHLYHFLFSHEFFEDPELVNQAALASVSYPFKQDRDAFVIQANALASFQEPINLKNIRCPVSMLTGANDVLMTADMLREFCQQHAQINYKIIDGAAHALHWERGDEVADFILSSLGSKL